MLTQQCEVPTQGDVCPQEIESSGQSYTLENFVELYPLPQLVSVTEGHYGSTDDFSMSEGAELVLFFKKKTQAVKATVQYREEPYYIPLNCSLQFSPYQRDSKEHLTKSYHYKTVKQLLSRRDGLPKVVKVLKGRKATPVLNANELLFPKGLSSQGTHLKFTDLKNEEIKLKLTCDIGFSTNPLDTKMHLADYVNIAEFPSPVMVFIDQQTSNEPPYEFHTGMEMVLQESKQLYSCICSTDVRGEMNYPLIELLTALPIEVKAINSPTVGLQPIYDTVKKIYETFNLSMVQSSMFVAHDDQHCYEEIRRSDSVSRSKKNYYDIEIPAVAFRTQLPPRKINQPKPLGPVVEESPPLPPRYPQSPPKVNVTGTASVTLTDKNRFYLRSFSVADTLRLLDKLNLQLFKGIFQHKNVDGKTLLSFTKYDLEEHGITNSVHQKQLLDVINGHITYKIK